MKCMTMVLKATALAKAREAYVRKFGEGPPEDVAGAGKNG